ncbi:MAG TPA: rhodanese-like domain-containing protein [Rectinemataceae bacterium]|nr:rhodanese-like domain-containing protein [Rectinemataceae bacterium]
MIGFVVGALAVIVGAAAIWFVWTTFAPSYRDPAARIAGKIAAGALVVDVRTPPEFKAGAYPEAVNFPLHEIREDADRLGPKDRPIVVYCASGHRSLGAAALLKKAGYSDVTNGGPLFSLPRR